MASVTYVPTADRTTAVVLRPRPSHLDSETSLQNKFFVGKGVHVFVRPVDVQAIFELDVTVRPPRVHPFHGFGIVNVTLWYCLSSF